jgi:K+/H+ antiporter YhaU regulatory subunit KhtT
MNIFATTIPGLFCLAVGVLSIIAMRRLLPNRKSPEEEFEDTGEYTVEMLVPSDNPNIGKTIAEAGLSTVAGGSLIEIRHFDGESIISPVPDDEPVMGGDRLVYAGQIAELLELEKTHGLVNSNHHVFSLKEVKRNAHMLRTAYVTFGSNLIGSTMGTNGFEKENKVTLVAVSRRGKRLEQSPREVVLKAGDTLLLESMNEFRTDTKALSRDLHFFDSEELPNIG